MPGDKPNLLGIITALADEARALGLRPSYAPAVGLHRFELPAQPGGEPIACLHTTCGVGASAASMAAKQLADAGANALITVGYAGALSDTLTSGDLVLADALHSDAQPQTLSQPLYATLFALLREHSLNPRSGGLLTSAHVVASAEQKHAAHRRTGAVMVDMESAAVHGFASNNRLGFAALRVILDDADTALPARVLRCVDNYGRVRPRAVAALLLRHPSAVTSLRLLGRQRQLATAALRQLPAPLARLSECVATEADG